MKWNFEQGDTYSYIPDDDEAGYIVVDIDGDLLTVKFEGGTVTYTDSISNVLSDRAACSSLRHALKGTGLSNVGLGAPGLLFAPVIYETTSQVYGEIAAERRRAFIKHSNTGGSVEDRDWRDTRWLPILVEEVGEAAKELNELGFGLTAAEGRPVATDAIIEHRRSLLRSELIQIAAMATAWVEACDRGK